MRLGEILINILWQYAKLFKKENTEAHRMRQDVEAFKVINIGRKGSEKEGGSGGREEGNAVMSKSTQPVRTIPSQSA